MKQSVIWLYLAVLILAVCLSIATAVKIGAVLWIGVALLASVQAVRLLLLE